MRIKKRLSKMARSIAQPTLQAMCDKSASYDVVSFDVFDTLVKRDVDSPTTVFEVVEQLVAGAGGFVELRIRAEAEARVAAGEREVTLDEIYRRFGELAESMRLPAIDVLKEAELEAEMLLMEPNLPMLEFFNRLMADNKRVIIISDIYLPRDFVADLLKKCGYSGWECLYVSSECGFRKREGGLFRYALDDLGLVASQVIHFGDSPIEDFRMPRKNGMGAMRVPTYRDSLQHEGDAAPVCLSDQISRSLANNCAESHGLGFERFGYEVLGPILTGFCQWLAQDLRKRRIDTVFFLSRDGYLVKRAFEELGYDKEFNCRYLYVSRQSLRTCALAGSGWRNNVALHISNGDSRPTVNVVLDNLGLDPKSCEEACLEAGVRPDERIALDDMKTDIRFGRLLDLLQQRIDENSREQLGIFGRYLRRSGFEGDVAVVDIGWRGTMQNHLNEICAKAGIAANIQGYYIGLRFAAGLDKRQGYLFSADHNVYDAAFQKSYIAPTELMFFADHGSVRAYSEVDGFSPVLYEYEYAELPDEARNIFSLQNGAIEFANDFLNYKSLGEGVSPDYSVGLIRAAFQSPNKKVLKMFGELPFLESGNQQKVIPDAGILRFGDFLHKFETCAWKAGFVMKHVRVKAIQRGVVKALYSRKIKNDW